MRPARGAAPSRAAPCSPETAIASSVPRGAAAGAAAALAWSAAEPALRAALRTPFSNARLLGAAATGGRRGWLPLGVVLHAGNGAAFGAAFAAAGGRGPRAGLVAALAEHVLAWPLLAVADRIHPDRRAGRWPPLLRNGRVFAQELAGHALFGAVLGALVREP